MTGPDLQSCAPTRLVAGPRDDNKPKAGGSLAPHRLYDIGNNRSEPLLRMIDLLETALGKKVIREFRPMQAGDVKDTCADIEAIQRDLGFSRPSRSTRESRGLSGGFGDVERAGPSHRGIKRNVQVRLPAFSMTGRV